MINFTHIEGRNRARIVLYALSTCAWCKKTKRLLQELGLGYDYVDVDLLRGEESSEAKRTIYRWNPRNSFPTIVVNNERCIAGFDENEIRKLAED